MISKWLRGDGFVNWGLGVVTGFALASFLYGIAGMTS